MSDSENMNKSINKSQPLLARQGVEMNISEGQPVSYGSVGRGRWEDLVGRLTIPLPGCVS